MVEYLTLGLETADRYFIRDVFIEAGREDMNTQIVDFQFNNATGRERINMKKDGG